MNKLKSLPSRLQAILASPRFFYLTVALLVVQALWIALSSHYPMAFDEDFHMGIIKLYAHHVSPFWGAHPAGADAFGAVARDPSYLFHWLMSFPYRLLHIFTHNESAIVIGLRLIDIGLFAASLPLFRRLLLKTGASRAVVHACLFVFVLLPVVPLLAAQVNYDNLLMPVVAGLLLLTLRIRDRLITQQVPLRDLSLLLGLGTLTCLIKYATLPIVVALYVYVTVVAWRVHSRKSLKTAFVAGWREVSRRVRWLLVLLLLVAGGLFAERYGINTLRYHTPIPDCDQVLSVQECSAYGPWVRDYNFNLEKTNDSLKGPVRYSGDWLWGMWFRTFFAVSGPEDMYQTRVPLPVPAIAVIAVAAVATVSFGLKARPVWRRYNAHVLWLFVVASGLYLGSLWVTEYKGYLHTGQPVAINGRYLVPVLLLAMVTAALAVYELLRRRRQILAVFTVVTFLAFMWGGGAWTYIIRSSDNWYWHNSLVYTMNHGVQHVLWPITPGAAQSNRFLRD